GSGNHRQHARFFDRLHPPLDVELPVNPREVGFHRVGRYAEAAGELLVGLAGGEGVENLDFARRQAERADGRVVADEAVGPRSPRSQPVPDPGAEDDERRGDQSDVDFGREGTGEVAILEPVERGGGEREQGRVEDDRPRHPPEGGRSRGWQRRFSPTKAWAWSRAKAGCCAGSTCTSASATGSR